MERVCFYWFCMQLKKFSGKSKKVQIVNFLNEVIHPILSYEKLTKLTDYPETTNPTRDIKKKEIRSDYLELIDISNEDKKQKEVKRLSRAFSELPKICNFKIDTIGAFKDIKKSISSNKTELKKYLSENDFKELLALLDEKEVAIPDVLALLLIYTIHYIPNFRDNLLEEVKESNRGNKISFLIDLLEQEIVFNDIRTYGLSTIIHNNTLFSEKFENDFIKIIFVPNDKFQPFSEKNKNEYLLSLLTHYDYLHILLTTSICDSRIIQRGFIASNSRIDRTIDRKIETVFYKTNSLPKLLVGYFDTFYRCIERIEDVVEIGSDSSVFISLENSIKEESLEPYDLKNENFENENLKTARFGRALRKITEFTENENIFFRSWTNGELEDGLICWLLISE